MKWLHDLKLATKLALAFTTVLTLTAFMGIFSIAQLAKVKEAAAELETTWMPSTRYALELKSQIARIRTRELQYIISTEPAEMDKYDKVIANDLVDLANFEKEYKKTISSPQAQALFDEFLSMWDSYMAEDAKIRAAARQSNGEEAKGLIRGQSNKLIVALRGQAEKMVTLSVEGGAQASLTGHDVYSTSRFLIVSLLMGSVALGALCAFIITRWLVGRLGGEPDYAVHIADRIASGELSVEIATRDDDQTSLLFAMKTMRNSLSNIVGQVRASTEAIASASSQIAAGNQDLSFRSEQQAGSLEETAASMEELTTTVKQNTDNARQANQLAVSASDVAQKGGAVVSQVVDTMGSINESAKKIVDIISVIDGIAFQTNILALNAAVEAARAGEQGRGFAVVATEVRTLAQRSAAAAKEIKILIGDSVDKVDAGSKLVELAGATMNEVVVSVKRVTDIMGEITTAGREQSAGIDQVHQAIAQMDQATQQNTALVEEAAATSVSLREQAQHLAELVSVFQIEGMGAAPQMRGQVSIHAQSGSLVSLKAHAGKVGAQAGHGANGTGPRRIADKRANV